MHPLQSIDLPRHAIFAVCGGYCEHTLSFGFEGPGPTSSMRSLTEELDMKGMHDI